MATPYTMYKAIIKFIIESRLFALYNIAKSVQSQFPVTAIKLHGN